MRTLVHNIACISGIERQGRLRLCGGEMGRMETLENAWLLVEDGRIAAFGSMTDDVPENVGRRVDAGGGMLFPSFCDSHTHLVYAGSREQEFLDKINGLSYEEIARRGGGILNSADRLHAASEDELYATAMERVREIVAMGTGCVEIKSGYGLSTGDELKMLRVIRRIRENAPLEVRATFLGAHAVARAYRGRQGEYVDLVCREMLPAVAREGLADFIDVFCDEGFFTVAETERIINEGRKYSLRAKIHANELAVSGGVQAGVRCGALSVDHLESSGAEEIEALRGSDTMPTLLPGAAFFLGMGNPPAREMIRAGLGVALASDYNPGSSPSGNMRMVCSLASIRLRMTPREALCAATLNGAYAMGLSRDFGSITTGKAANFFLTRPIPSVEFFTYAYQTPLIEKVFLRGEEFVTSRQNT
ncbi:MAG TPA: imidazolonepropionase [Candidatus Cryptobacteroides excrementigallinarum]|nr:imidazolonepropionase [Candidatus Cryptobacteroides excrementigallinarum]